MTAIEWTDRTWNPTTGCDRVSPGCDNCYALTMARRLKAMGQPVYQRDGNPRTSGPGFGLTVHPDRLDLPLRWRKPARIFVNSMSDLFHPQVPEAFIADVFEVMEEADQHTFQILTKRPQRMANMLRSWEYDPLPNVWLGTSVENQRYADLRIPHLLATPAAVRFLSVEPLVGPVTFRWAKWAQYSGPVHNELDGLKDIRWVIVGGESGHGARPVEPTWVYELRDECVKADVPFLFKQWGGRTPKANGRHLDGRTWDEYPA